MDPTRSQAAVEGFFREVTKRLYREGETFPSESGSESSISRVTLIPPFVQDANLSTTLLGNQRGVLCHDLDDEELGAASLKALQHSVPGMPRERLSLWSNLRCLAMLMPLWELPIGRFHRFQGTPLVGLRGIV